MSFSMFTMISWLRSPGAPAADKFVLQTHRRGTRSARPTVQNLRVRPQRSRRAARVHSISKAAGVPAGWAAQMERFRSSDTLRFHEQQHDAADEHKRTDRRRNKMAVRGRNVQPQKLDGLARGREAQARIGKHHNPKRDEQD